MSNTIKETPKEIDFIVEQTDEAFTNALCNDEEAEKWFDENDDKVLVMRFHRDFTEVEVKKK